MTSLIISPNTETLSLIESVLKENFSGHVVTADSGNEARRTVYGDIQPDLVIIDTPLTDEFGLELAVMLSDVSNVILICRNDIYEDISSSLPPEVIVVPKPFTRDDLRNSVEAFPEMHGLKRESADILMKIDEMRLINRAKCTLMEYLKFTEPQAHRYIEKQAMNNRQTRREVAEKILKTYKK